MFKDGEAGLSLPSITITPLCRKAGGAGGGGSGHTKSAPSLLSSSHLSANGVAASFQPFRCVEGSVSHPDPCGSVLKCLPWIRILFGITDPDLDLSQGLSKREKNKRF